MIHDYRAISDATRRRIRATGARRVISDDGTWRWDVARIARKAGFKIVRIEDEPLSWQSTADLLRRLDRPYGSIRH